MKKINANYKGFFFVSGVSFDEDELCDFFFFYKILMKFIYVMGFLVDLYSFDIIKQMKRIF
jgi:hypothetical protein